MPIEELIILLRNLPPQIICVDFGNNCLDKLEPNFARFLAAMPPSIQILRLRNNYLDGGRDIHHIPGKISAKIIKALEGGVDLQKGFAALRSSNVIELDLGDNHIGGLPTKEILVPTLKALPEKIKKLNLQNNALDRKSPRALAKLLAAIPRNIDTLDLRKNNLGSKSAAELAIVFAALPSHVTTIYLCENGLNLFSEEELDLIHDALPASVKFIGWDDPEAEEGFTLFEWAKVVRPVTPASSITTVDTIEVVVVTDSPSLGPLTSPHNFFRGRNDSRDGASAPLFPDEIPISEWASLV
jgi:hypothetical protein